ncbi:Hpt domain-containing protein [uncultured Pseudodesulfovibrio sp.]|uniref:Hpt domain-containing protein n=1 Tax=uncultured Pseudodesulfovibrio sp. TaxID=2035858 RepID=UPI0029C963EA|nr:Hpt domain-containing protein [uncultured Pseudodesulfovibrio sp.]
MIQSLFDKEAFLESLANDEELACELINAFLEDCPIRTESLVDALDTNDAVTASKMAHSLKGMCGVVRADVLSELALDMELAAREGQLDLVRELYAQFSDFLEQVNIQLEAFRDGR